MTNIDSSSFLYTRHRNLYFVALTNANVNPALVFEFLFQKIKILKAYLGEDFDESHIRNNMTLIYELFDEVMDFGYPQNCAIDVLKLFLGEKKGVQETEPSQVSVVSIPSTSTFTFPYRSSNLTTNQTVLTTTHTPP